MVNLVDQPSQVERSKLAKKLASKHDLAAWLTAMREFGSFAATEPGLQRFEPTLLGKPVELFVYVPEKYAPDKPAPLMLTAHGTGWTGRAQHEEWKAVADKLGMLVLSPTVSGDNGGYTFSQAERDETLAALRWTRRHFNVDENRVHLSGMSRGGHLAWDIALRDPTPFASLAPMIGGPRLSNSNGQNTLRYLENVAHLPIRDLQGSGDSPELLFNLRLAFKRLEAFPAVDAKLLEFADLGHSYRFNSVNWAEFLGGARRAAVPERVVRCVANLEQARSAWLEVTRLDKGVKEKFQLRVNGREWQALSDEEQRLQLQAAADERTGRIELRMESVGVFEGEGERVSGFRILLTETMFDAKTPVSIRFNRRTEKRRPKPSCELLLTEFAEHFDRTFLPVAEVSIKR